MEKNNLINPGLENENEEKQENVLRPKRLKEYIGQTKVKENMKVYIEAAKLRHEPLDHVLLYGPPGLGKTTLANIISNEMNSNIKITSGPAIEKAGDLAALLTNLSEFDVLFVSSIRRLYIRHYNRQRTNSKINKIRFTKVYIDRSNDKSRFINYTFERQIWNCRKTRII